MMACDLKVSRVHEESLVEMDLQVGKVNVVMLAFLVVKVRSSFICIYAE